MLSDQNNFADAQYFSDPSEQVTSKDQRTTVPTKPTKQQLLEAEIDQAFHEVFEADQQHPTEDNPHTAVFDEMADDLYQTMLQEQAKEEAAAGLTPIPNQAKALDSSTQGWTNNGNIQYNMQEEISAAPTAQQEFLRQFWDETKNRFSAGKLLFGTQPYGSFQPAFAIGDSQSFYGGNSSDASARMRAYTNEGSNALKWFNAREKNSANNQYLRSNDGGQNSTSKRTLNSYTYKNGIYEKADYHSGQTTGKKNPAPKDGQFALDNSVPISQNAHRRIGLDCNGDFVVLDETSLGKFHGHIRKWGNADGNQGLTQSMKGALYDAGYIKAPLVSKFKLTNYAKSLIDIMK